MWVCLVKKENMRKAEEILKKDDIASRQSIMIRDAKSLGFNEDGFYFLIDGDEHGVNRAKELIKDLAAETKNADKVRKKIKEEEEKAAEGFGGIFG